MGTNTNSTNTDVSLTARTARRLDDVWPDSVVRALFAAELLALGMRHLAQDEFRGAPAADDLAQLGEVALLRADLAGDEIEALIRLGDGAIAFVDVDHGTVTVEVAAMQRGKVVVIRDSLRDRLASSPAAPNQITVAFWISAARGGDVRHKEIDAPSFEQIADNYSADVKQALCRLAAARAPDGGRLILWRGEPGTGKSHALRALVRAWKPWCSAHFVIDPDELLRGGSYLLDVLTWDDGAGRWRLLILEDAGELIASDARTVSGQALSRLLNIADGLLGQGTRTLILITTNEPVKRLHPATRRAGRCVADIEFTALAVAEANAWLRARGQDHRVEVPTTIADLYSHPGRGPMRAEQREPSRFGFARALEADGPLTR